MRSLTVLQPGPATTVQDLGRPGHAALGVGASGAADRHSLVLGNRLLGNTPQAAGLEVPLGGLAVHADADVFVAVTGALGPLKLEGQEVAGNAVIALPAGKTLRLGTPHSGLRSYLTVRGGIDTPVVLGSRSTDTLAGVGPAQLQEGDVLPVGPPPDTPPLADIAPVPALPDGDVGLRVVMGPRQDWFSLAARHTLLSTPYTVTTKSDRVGMRLDGTALSRAREDELPSEGMVRGALQVPAGGQPVLFLADHPLTGGYPVIAVVVSADVDRAAQVRPGQHLHFRAASPDYSSTRRSR